MSRDLLLEILAEELPASFVAHASAFMAQAAERSLVDARLAPSGAIKTYGTPRRLALHVGGVPDAQPDRRETVVGPPEKAGLAADGSFTQAALGFAKKAGAGAEGLRVIETPKGRYVAVDVEERGRAASAVLPSLLQDLCQRIPFPKAMRWGQGDHAFGRPVHRVVALHGGDVVSFDFAGVTSGRTTVGHRFRAPGPIELADPAAYLPSLRAAHVLADLDERRQVMLERLRAMAAEIGGVLEEDAFLRDECVSLVEDPALVSGTIDARFLDLPDEVIVSVMRTHQRYFAVRKQEGGLLPRYLNVVNTALSPETIAKGNDRVLRARLNDAAFFVREDRKKGFDPGPRLDVLDRVVFQQKLGSVGQKIRRVKANARALAEREGLDVGRVDQAVDLAKIDLTTYIVGEFPELQGVMGRFYAKESGVDAEVADTIAEHYRPAGAEDGLPATKLASVVAVADRIDTLVGCFGIGLVPTGSADPFALRRAALGIIRIGTYGVLDVDLDDFLGVALAQYQAADAHSATVLGRDKGNDVIATLKEFFVGRLRVFHRERYAGDVVDAALSGWDHRSLRDLDARMKALDAFRSAEEYASLAVAFKRAFNIAKDVAPGAYDPARLEDGAEKALADAFEGMRPKLEAAVQNRAYEEALSLLGRELRGPIDRYFTEVFVMVDDLAMRENRLRLVRSVADAVRRIVHFELLSP